MERKEMRVSDIAKKSGLPYTSVKSILEPGVEKANYVNICNICESIGITTDQLERIAKDKPDNPLILPRKTTEHSDKRLQKIVVCYNNMNETGKNNLLKQAEFLENKHLKSDLKEKAM
ncbi:MAG: hypothetical protein OSJ62_04935 [Lachnospiraceae bacterium]|nr:hypothetical protein [Lachnospiraceae bacterium]